MHTDADLDDLETISDISGRARFLRWALYCLRTGPRKQKQEGKINLSEWQIGDFALGLLHECAFVNMVTPDQLVLLMTEVLDEERRSLSSADNLSHVFCPHCGMEDAPIPTDR
jgi:hypothetical protein